MPFKIQVGISKKVGLPDYGSLGASCQVELELGQSLNPDDLDGFQQRVHEAYSACRQAVEEELAARQKKTGPEPLAKSQDGSHGAANGQANGRNGHGASQKQLDYIDQLAGQIRGLGTRRLEALAGKMYAKPLSGLVSLEASGLIDVLKEIKAGKIDLNTALSGVAT